MARIRTIKPDYYTSLTTAELSMPAFAMFPGLLTHADDQGRFVDEPRLVKAALFPLRDDITAGDVDAYLNEYVAQEMLRRYEVDGKKYCEITNFLDHQAISKPKKSKLPDPPQIDSSSQRPGHVPDTSRTTTGTVLAGKEGNGKEGNGKIPPEDGGRDVWAVFDFWRCELDHPKAKLDDKRRRRIQQALKTYSIEDCRQAITGCAMSPWHQGQNDRSTKYDDIELILRDATHIERFMAFATNPPDGTGRDPFEGYQ